MKLIKSFTNDNAVKVVAFAISFSKELTTDEILNFVSSANENEYLKSNFTNISNQEEIAMTLSPDATLKHTQSIGGIVATILDDKQNTIWNLEANKTFIAIRCYSYSCWQSVYEKASIKFEEIFKILNNENIVINNIMLEYLDEFEILESSSDWKKQLFTQECPFLLNNIYQLDDFWHVNHGYFKNIDSSRRLLDNHHINYFADVNDFFKHKVNIRMQHKLAYENVVQYKKESIDNDFSMLHKHTKEIFNQIINKDILKNFK